LQCLVNSAAPQTSDTVSPTIAPARSKCGKGSPVRWGGGACRYR
jgi:hypothetical protein